MLGEAALLLHNSRSPQLRTRNHWKRTLDPAASVDSRVLFQFTVFSTDFPHVFIAPHKKKKSQSTLLFLFFDDYVCASLQSRHMKKDCLLSFTYLILHFFFCLLLFDRLCIDAQYVKRSMTSKTDRRKRREDEKKKEEKKKAVSHRKHDNKEGRRLNKWRTIVVFLLIEYLCYHRGKKDEGEMVQSHVPKTERLQAKKKKDGE